MLRILVNTMKKWTMPFLVIWKVVAKRDFLHVFRCQDFRYTQGDRNCSAFGILNSDVAVRSKALAVTVYFSMILDPFHVNLDLWPSIRMYGCWKKNYKSEVLAVSVKKKRQENALSISALFLTETSFPWCVWQLKPNHHFIPLLGCIWNTLKRCFRLLLL